MKHMLNVPMVCLNCGVVHNYSGTYDPYPFVECPDCHSLGTSVIDTNDPVVHPNPLMWETDDLEIFIYYSRERA